MIYSPYLKEYVEIGHIATYGDFLSRRLMLVNEQQMKSNLGYEDMNELYILSGTFMNITKMIGCVIENCQSAESNDQETLANIEQYLRVISNTSVQT